MITVEILFTKYSRMSWTDEYVENGAMSFEDFIKALKEHDKDIKANLLEPEVDVTLAGMEDIKKELYERFTYIQTPSGKRLLYNHITPVELLDFIKEKLANLLEPEVGVTLAEDVIACIPTTWLDPLLTGKDKVLPDGYEFTPKDIENLLLVIKQKMETVVSKRTD